jgi:sulfonate dioxygenase
MQQFLEGLSTQHSAMPQAIHGEKIELARRPPLVRKHPVTGRKALWLNKIHMTKIVGLKKPKSDLIFDFLTDQFTVA